MAGTLGSRMKSGKKKLTRGETGPGYAALSASDWPYACCCELPGICFLWAPVFLAVGTRLLGMQQVVAVGERGSGGRDLLIGRPTGRGGGGWVSWKFWVGGCPNTSPPPLP